MKNVFVSIVLCVIIFFVISCKKYGGFLEQTSTTNLNEETVFSDSALSMDFLSQIYTSIDFSFYPGRFGGKAGMEACCDEAEGPSSTSITTYNQFATGSVGAYSISTDAWNIPYTQIRAVNQFLAHLTTIPFPDYLKQRTRGEAIFLRAWYYSIMLKHYGGIPIIGDSVYDVNDNINAARNTYEESVNYILSQCDSAFNLVSSSYNGLDFGRITKGACLALKVKVLVYAASPLFNGGQTETSEPLRSLTGYPSYDVNRWKLAADAAKAVIDLQLYHLNVDNTTSPGYGFYNLFNLRVNIEYIFQRMQPDTYNDLEGLWRPPSRGGNSTTGSWPYQNLVDAFQMSNGKDITDLNSGYDPNNPYTNREPRLNYTITHNESMIADGQINDVLKPVYIYVGEPNGDGFGVGTPTGYYVNKMCKDEVRPEWVATTHRCYPLIRYADILLMYAEALNEFSGPSKEVYDAVDSVRWRAGLSPYQLPAGLSQDDMRKAIQHERQVELAFEEHRFFDVRRWKIADETENKIMTGMKITRDISGNYVYQVVDVRAHNFRPSSMYLWPFPQSETAKSPELLQNPGY